MNPPRIPNVSMVTRFCNIPGRGVRRCAPPRPVVNEQRKHAHQPFLLVNNQSPPRPDVLHVREGFASLRRTGRDLLLAAQHAEGKLSFPLLGVGVGQHRAGHHPSSRRRIVHRLVAVLMADAILGESADLAVIAFERVEVRVGGANQDFAGSPFGGRNVMDQPRARRDQQRKRRSLMFRS